MTISQELTFITPDMSCSHCVAAIEGAVNQVPGVRSVQADLDTKTVQVDIDAGRASENEIRDALETAGYPAT